MRELGGGVGGGVRWDLRGAGGARVPSGIYLYVASDRSGTRRGHLVVAR